MLYNDPSIVIVTLKQILHESEWPRTNGFVWSAVGGMTELNCKNASATVRRSKSTSDKMAAALVGVAAIRLPEIESGMAITITAANEVIR
jgi:hypothetical protein